MILNSDRIELATETKFILVIFFVITLTTKFPFYLEIINIVLVSILFLCINNRKRAIKLILSFAILSIIPNLPIYKIEIMQVLATWSLIIRRLLIPFNLGYYFLYSTQVSSLLASMERIRIPKIIRIPFLVMFRYTPIIKNEFKHISEAMKLRGIGKNMVFSNPLLYMEYLIIPLLFSATNIGEDLSQAAFSKGLSIDGKKYRCSLILFSYLDILAILYIFLLLYIVRG